MVEPAILESITWTAQSYSSSRGDEVSLIEGTAITARFEGGRLAGSAGCNACTAAYSLAGNCIEIGRAACTRKACLRPPGIMEQEAAYLAALVKAKAYRIEGSRLILESATGAPVVSFVPAAQAPAPDPSPGTAHRGWAKIKFDPAPIDDAGLTGPPDGRVAVSYEYCIPATPEHQAEVQRIDPTVTVHPGSPGRIGCVPGQVLCIGSTHQPDWRSVLQGLAALEYVTRIDRHFAE